jgi:hypothetical protein
MWRLYCNVHQSVAGFLHWILAGLAGRLLYCLQGRDQLTVVALNEFNRLAWQAICGSVTGDAGKRSAFGAAGARATYRGRLLSRKAQS